MSVDCYLDLETVIDRILIYIDSYRPGGSKLKWLNHIIE